MIPKSVSASTRIVALTVMLAWPVWGWAGESIWMSSGKHDTVAWVEYTENGKVVIIDVTCYRRMREAMQKLDTVKNRSKMDYYGMEIAVTHIWLAEHWRPVMNDCVEGGRVNGQET